MSRPARRRETEAVLVGFLSLLATTVAMYDLFLLMVYSR